MTPEELKRDKVLKSFDRAEKRAKIQLALYIIGMLFKFIFYAAIVWLIIIHI